ncbi:helix-turn-helix domain-containing protein [Embleya scabrispora]|uniref:helix-turn-helix domain-containing protein n=1 Tax=Embleya scabrispora TaxID=159449 RepID=UPI0003809A0D|nr:helix-turn-helix transcriptional regulator [Embleya scabrispora]MYS86470.1 helix-turn-helix domain-containing protein [Streptomyces sp. SID5474]
MATTGPGSLKARKELGSRLRALRGRRTAKAVAEQINVSPSTVTRAETGDRNCTEALFKKLMTAYDVRGQERAELEELAEQIWESEAPWWHAYGDSVSANYATHLEYEADAVLRREYGTLLVPAHLQTAEYSRAVTSVGFAALGPDQVDDLVRVRAHRQRRLYDDPLLSLEVVLSEAALAVEVGGPEVHRAQLRHMLEITQLPNVDVRVIAYTAGENGTQPSPFNLLSYAGDEEPDVAFAASVAGSLLLDTPKHLVRLNRLFRNLREQALSPEASRELITALSEKD